MKEIFDFKIQGIYAHRYLEQDVGKHLGPNVEDDRLVRVAKIDPLYERIGQLADLVYQQYGKHLFLDWDIDRTYTPDEIASATLFQIDVTSVFRPPGEDCGTKYDTSTACPICHAGRKRTSPLILDLRKAPKTSQISCTIAYDEIIVSQQLAEVFAEGNVTGIELRPARHKAKYVDDAIDLKRYPSGRELVRQAEEQGYSEESGQFYVWLNKQEQKELFDRARAEHAALKQGVEKRRTYKPPPIWYELVVTSRRLDIVPPSHCGDAPFEDDLKGLYTCPLGHALGLNLLTELYVSSDSWDGSDVMFTKQMTGWEMGYLVPAPKLVVSKKVYDLLKQHKIKGYRSEITHLV